MFSGRLIVVMMRSGMRIEKFGMDEIAGYFDGHLEEDEKDWKDQEICDAGSDCPGSGEVGVVYHVDPVLQSGHCVVEGKRWVKGKDKNAPPPSKKKDFDFGNGYFDDDYGQN